MQGSNQAAQLSVPRTRTAAADAALCACAQIQKIVRSIPPQRQTLFFSATWPREVKAIAAQFVTHDTVHVFVGGGGGEAGGQQGHHAVRGDHGQLQQDEPPGPGAPARHIATQIFTCPPACTSSANF